MNYLVRSLTRATLSLLLSMTQLSCNAQTASQQVKNGVAIQPTGFISPAVGTTAHSVENIRAALHDKNGNYWFGSDGGGVYRYDGKSIVLFTDKDGLCHNQIRTIEEDNAGNIWFTTGDGICRYDGRSFEAFRSPEKVSRAVDWKKEPGSLWFPAGFKKGIYRCKGDSFFNYQFPGAEEESRSSTLRYDEYEIYCIFEDREGNIWFGTQSKGVCRFDGKNFLWLRDRGLAGAAIRTIYQDKAGNMWFGNNGYGLFRYDGKVLSNVSDEKGLANPEFIKKFKEKEGTLARVWTISEDARGDLWIGTIDAGAWRYDGKHMTNYSTKDGLTDRGVTVIYRDKKGELWFGTAGELCKFNGKRFEKVSLP